MESQPLPGPTSPRAASTKPDPEFTTDAKRRTFTADYKLRILEEADAASGDGLIGALLRREGLYSSLLSTWRRERLEGTLDGRKRGPQARPVDLRDEELRKLRRENERLASPGWPGTVTVPASGRSGCWYCRWSPRVRSFTFMLHTPSDNQILCGCSGMYNLCR